MELPLGRPARLLLGAGAACALGWTLLAWALGNPLAPVLAAGLGLLVVAGTAALATELNERRRLQDYAQMEAYVSLVTALQPAQPLPATRHWAASPDVLKKTAELVLQRAPRLVVEASCGTSTVIIALCLRKLGQGGRVISLEHDPVYAEKTRRALRQQGLEDIATVLQAPLKPYDLGGQRYHWYDLAGLEPQTPIDLLVVDGPPGAQRKARYPAVPLLIDRLAPDAVVIVDDGARPDEREMVEDWRKAYGLQPHYLHFEKGAYVIGRGTPGELL